MSFHSHDLVSRAAIFSARMHHKQFRANKARDPYIFHLSEVATLVRRSGGSDIEIASAYLHDIVEDTSVTIDGITVLFGPVIAEIVDGLTDPPEFVDLPILARKARQAERVKGENNSVKRIKMADQVSNVCLTASDPPLVWNRQRCIDYATGAKLIAMNCRGVSEFLDLEFDKAFNAVMRAYS